MPEEAVPPTPSPTPDDLAQVPAADDSGKFLVRLDNFTGPFDLLLQLIGKHKLDVTEVALHTVTDDFIAYIRAMGDDWDLGEASEFLLVAATLLDLKAARLLPAAEVEDEEDLALLEARDLLFARLLQYKAFKEAAAYISDLEGTGAKRYPRAVSMEPRYAEALPDLVLGIGVERLFKLALKQFTPRPGPPQVSIAHIHQARVSVPEHAQLLRDRLRRAGSATFTLLVADCENTLEVVARFLALLELYRQNLIDFDQPVSLDELTVRWIGGDDSEVELEVDDYEGTQPEPDQAAAPLPDDADDPEALDQPEDADRTPAEAHFADEDDDEDDDIDLIAARFSFIEEPSPDATLTPEGTPSDEDDSDLSNLSDEGDGDINIDGGGDVDRDGDVNIDGGGDVDRSGDVDIDGDVNVDGHGVVDRGGDINIDGGSDVDRSGDINIDRGGDINIDRGGDVDGDGVNIDRGGDVDGDGVNIDRGGDVDGDGVNIDGGGDVDRDGDVDIDGGGGLGGVDGDGGSAGGEVGTTGAIVSDSGASGAGRFDAPEDPGDLGGGDDDAASAVVEGRS